ncbi:tRNA-dihydrouridine(47) synthase [NAD(P)(+)]-like isoform X1 [Macaca mulatta]
MAEGTAEAPLENGGGGDSGAGALERGVAPIKPQYLTTKEQFHQFLEAKGQEKPCRETEVGDSAGNDLAEPEAKRIRLEDGQTEDGQTEEAAEPREQPQTQKRARGQNKGRPHVKPTHYDKNRLCPSLIQESAAKCFFGDRCRFLHDVRRYLETKPADLGPRCVLFQTFGRCPYGVTCRFAGAHLGPEGQNLVQEELAARGAQPPPVRNGLDKALQQQLRKREVRFERAEQALRRFSQGQPPGPTPAAAVPEGTAAEGAPRQGNCGAQQVPTGLGTSTPPSSPVRTCGPLTDEDVVRLRPCEKKRVRVESNVTYVSPAPPSVWEPALPTDLQALRGGRDMRRDGRVHQPAAGPDVRVGAAQTPPVRRRLWRPVGGRLPRHHDQVRRAAEPHRGGGLCGHQRRLPHRPRVQEGRGLCPHESLHQVPADRSWHEPGVGRATDCEDPHRRPGACEPGAPPAARAAGLGRGTRHAWLSRCLSLCVSLSASYPAWRLLPQLHGRSREQRYTKLADWQYIEECVKAASPMPLFGNGDILSFEDANRAMQTGVAGIMIARGALLKPWLFTEIKEQRHWDISSSERLDILRDFTNYGLEHWGSDTQGVEKTRRFLLEWLSFLCRYVPVGLLERLPQRINERPPYYLGRDYLETLMASQKAADWIRISEMLLGPVPPNFVFLPKHKANAYK